MRVWVSCLDCDIRRVRCLVIVYCSNNLCPVAFCDKGCGCGAAVAEIGADSAILERSQEAITPAYDVLELERTRDRI